ncbi:uncharacterized protein Z518_08398 [Rhinocladiella mackenziei CBS 650.93]|uniref:Rhinocladiella mackenziei CBS 650.93 unplaced genomic scaffold supercont1.6, whole genome shotgun sequence n=1 Tax=Rhinocladiella mackenziei CBS 650.93 TaxID=1442369 RepID=A0A0D2FKJ6_9EURO|nr:uncharacterized protein Z518_08398 [Rhinocladiella mackenziei CBS 650.93]KIX02457.1 hypothetical protein Z518_08398 [Rhinocladiella mackenziei CBS 650.93]
MSSPTNDNNPSKPEQSQNGDLLTEMAKFMCKDSDNHVLRRFDKLNLYNLLSLQDRLIPLATEMSSYEGKDHMKMYGFYLDKALLDYAEMEKLRRTPRYVKQQLKRGVEGFRALGFLFDGGDGWDELSSFRTKEKGAIHNFIDYHTPIPKLISKVPPQNQSSD